MIDLAHRKTKSKQASHGTLRRMRAAVRPPVASVLRGLSPKETEMLNRRLREPAECIYHPSFAKLLRSGGPRRPALNVTSTSLSIGLPSDPDVAAATRETFVLTATDERDLFTWFNYCRYRVMRVLKQYEGQRLSADGTRELLHWERAADDARSDIVRANTALPIAMARRTKQSTLELADLVCEGNLALVRCVDKFDCTRGFKFSTYACRAILASFSRAAMKANRYRSQFPAPFDPSLERSDHLERRRDDEERGYVDDLKRILLQNTAELSAVERNVLSARFSLDVPEPVEPATRGKTLEQVGLQLGVSKERVRQIQNQALEKLRKALDAQYAMSGLAAVG